MATHPHIQRMAVQIVNLREQRQMSQVQLAERCGCDHATISRIESGQRTPSLDLMIRIAAALNVPPAWLFSRDLVTTT